MFPMAVKLGTVHPGAGFKLLFCSKHTSHFLVPFKTPM